MAKPSKAQWRTRLIADLRSERKHYCWACGRGEHDHAGVWHGPWWLQLAHLRAGGGVRALDRRAVNLLCPLCHTLHSHNGGRLQRIGDVEIQQLSNANMVWIKREFDAEYYDPEYLQTLWIGLVPEPERPDDWYGQEMRLRRRLTVWSTA